MENTLGLWGRRSIGETSWEAGAIIKVERRLALARMLTVKEKVSGQLLDML